MVYFTGAARNGVGGYYRGLCKFMGFCISCVSAVCHTRQHYGKRGCKRVEACRRGISVFLILETLDPELWSLYIPKP